MLLNLKNLRRASFFFFQPSYIFSTSDFMALYLPVIMLKKQEGASKGNQQER